MLWERVAPRGLVRADWSFADERLERLRELGIRPIVGLVHHGSGPLDTSLLDPDFAPRLAEFARAVAERYPWVDAYTPVNEPLTTARFSCLYGHWYPHARDDLSFARALVNECRAVVCSMRAIREVRPDAELIQTEDVGRTFATPPLEYQAELENERRWLTFDLLCGRLGEPMAGWLRMAGIEEAELEWFRRNPCPPDVIGINHYLSGERFLDHRLQHYPPESHGGNGRHAYADVLAARVLTDGAAGPEHVLRETWERYELPIAVTEAHNGCTREEQLRWLDEVWEAASTLNAEGVDLRAVTVWSLLGTYAWNTLVTCDNGFYEPGVFDVRGGEPRPTALARMTRSLAQRGSYDHPVLDSPGWWRRDERLWYPQVQAAIGAPARRPRGTPRPLAIVGANGTLGRAFARACDVRGLEYRLLARADLDLADPGSVAKALEHLRPWAVVNAAGYVRVDDAELEPERCFRENAEGPAATARECAARSLPFVTFSSDLVFDGTKEAPYVESDAPAPLNIYGASKAEGERRVLAEHPGALVVRTSAFFGPWDEYNFVTQTLRALAAGETVEAADDSVVSPTYVPDLVEAALDLLIDGEDGLWHLASAGATSWAELARLAAERAGLDASAVAGCSSAELGLVARRPAQSALASERGQLLRSLDDALERYFVEAGELSAARA